MNNDLQNLMNTVSSIMIFVNGEPYILDGQHRRAAATRLMMWEKPCQKIKKKSTTNVKPGSM